MPNASRCVVLRLCGLVLFLSAASFLTRPCEAQQALPAQDFFASPADRNAKAGPRGSGKVSELPSLKDKQAQLRPNAAMRSGGKSKPWGFVQPQNRIPSQDNSGPIPGLPQSASFDTIQTIPEPTPRNSTIISNGSGRKLQAPSRALYNVNAVSAASSADFNSLSYNAPPDPTLCTGNGQLLHLSNQVVLVMNAATGAYVASLSMRDFFERAEGDFTSLGASRSTFYTPRCVYDPVGLRWVVVAGYGEYDFFGNLLTSTLYIAITKTRDITLDYHWFSYEMGAECGNSDCLFDQPQLGLDTHGIWITGTKFSKRVFQGNKVIVISKAKAYANTLETTCEWDDIKFGKPAKLLAAIQPARITTGSRYTAGTQYALASFDATSLWKGTFTGTAGLAQGCATLRLTQQLITRLQRVVDPPTTIPQPLGGTALWLQDARLHQVVFAGGLLYATRHTAIRTTRGTFTAVAIYVINPVTNRPTYQRILSGNSIHFMVPAITAKASGKFLVVTSVLPLSAAPNTGLTYGWTWGDARNASAPISTTIYSHNRRYCGFTTPLAVGSYSGADIGSDGMAYGVAHTVAGYGCSATTLANWLTTVFKVNINA